MDLRSHLLRLIAPAGVGDEILPGARLVGASTELGLRLTFEVGDQDVHVEVEPLAEGRRWAVRSEHVQYAYRVGDRANPIDEGLGLRLCRAVAARAAPLERAVLAAIAEDARAARTLSDDRARVREVRVERLLEPAGTRRERYYTLSPYVGCTIGCRFCYAQSRLATARRLEMLPEAPWGSWVDVRVNAPEVLASELEQLEAHPIKLCPIVSDPYQALERRYRLTRRCLEVIGRARTARPVLVLTRSSSIIEDVALFASLPLAWAGASVPTVDEDVRRHFEPRAAPIAARLEALAALRAAGVRTFAIVQPVLPGPIEALADALRVCADSVRIDVLYGVEGADAEFSDPRFAFAARDEWQHSQAQRLAQALAARGVRVWPRELPEELTPAAPR
jgi:DNA repair photolyase